MTNTCENCDAELAEDEEVCEECGFELVPDRDEFIV